MSRKAVVEICSVPLRRPKYLPRIRYGTHSWIQAFHDTPAIAPKQLVVKNHVMIQRPAASGWSRGIQGRRRPSATHDTRCSAAAVTEIVFACFHFARKGAMKICTKLPRNGRALMSPMVVLGS